MIPWTWDPEYKGIDDYLYAQSKIGGVTHWVDDVKPAKSAHVMVPIMTPEEGRKDDDIQIPLPPVPKKRRIGVQNYQYPIQRVRKCAEITQM